MTALFLLMFEIILNKWLMAPFFPRYEELIATKYKTQRIYMLGKENHVPFNVFRSDKIDIRRL